MKISVLKKEFKKYLFFVALIGSLGANAQDFYISGTNETMVGTSELFIIFDSYYQTPSYNNSYSWNTNGIIAANGSSSYTATGANTIEIRWSYPGTNYMAVSFYDNYYYDYYSLSKTVNVTGSPPPAPEDPEWNLNTCAPILTRNGTVPSGTTWYWQGKVSNGTSTSKGSGSTYVPNEGSGIYYIRAKNSSGTWSSTSASVEILLPSKTLWYTDTDNDGLGDPSSTPISSCTQPAGRVDNDLDLCPGQYGSVMNNGCAGSSDPGSTTKNYVHTIQPLVGVTDISQITNQSDKIEMVTYFDGLNRPIQKVGIRYGGQQQDIKHPIIYDEFGRKVRNYLDVAATSSSVGNFSSNISVITALNSYYLNKYPSQLNSTSPNTYSETRYDNSPLNRILETGRPGQVWQIDPNSDSDHTLKLAYGTNESGEIYQISYPGTNQSLSLTTYYPPGTLTKNVTKNENWQPVDGKINTTEIFKDKEGKKIAEFNFIKESSTVKTIKTYYVYDSVGNLVYVLTPKIFSTISGTTISTTLLNNLAYQYVYDSFNRQIEQKVPGAKQWEYVVYDLLDRPILIQDSELKNDGKWLFIKYDAFGRTIYSGFFNSTLNRSSLQSAVDNFINSSNNKSNIESRTASTNSIGGVSMNYTNGAYPISSLETLTVNYFDDYLFNDPDKPSTPSIILNQAVTSNIKGLPSASWTKTIDGSTWSKTYTYYNEKGEVIDTYEKNYLGGFTDAKLAVDFRGKAKSFTTTHKRIATSPILTINDRYEYDHAERLTEQYQTINSQSEQQISKIIVDELGNMISKKIGGSNGSNLQTLDYKYDIRGALKAVNDVDNMGGDLYAYELNYDSGEGANYSSPQFNGNLSQIVWKSAQNNIKKSYFYEYDDLKRLSKARYGEGSSLNTNWQKYEVSITGYDYNGNILSLTRNGGSSGSIIDNLTYLYDTSNGNQLMKINDSSVSTGFKNGTNSGDDYAYDQNGNLTKDLNKDISSIEYNYLDLVKKITFSTGASIEFFYDAMGKKLQMKFSNGGNVTTTDYLGGFQYENLTLKFFPTSEGYAENNSGVYKYVYVLKDHLGNNRISFKDSNGDNIVSASDILSSTDYYPMGMIQYGEFNSNSYYNYKYQGKEFLLANNYNVYDFGSRMYDASVGRWFNVDPQNQFYSPYLAMGDIWVLGVDPNGELFGIDDLVVGLITGSVNVIGQALGGNIDSWGDGFAYFGIGFVAGLTATYTGGLGTAAILTAGNSAYGQYDRYGSISPEQLVLDTAFGVATAGISAGLTSAIAPQTSGLFSNVNNQLAKSVLVESTTQASVGFTLATGTSLLSGQSMEESLQTGFESALTSAAVGAATGAANHYAYKNQQARELKKQEQIELEKQNNSLVIEPESETKLLNAAPAKLTNKRLEHIIERHWNNSNAKGAGKFSKDITVQDLKTMINTASTKGTFRPNTNGRKGTIAEFNFGRSIGTNINGGQATSISVVISPDGFVITAFPF